MTPKEKAQELLQKYDFVYIQNYTSMFEVKQCCFIHCDDFIHCFSKFNGMYDQDVFDSIRVFWEEVKQELEKL